METKTEYGPAFTMMTANLAPGEKIKVEPGAMVAQSDGLETVSYTHLTLPTTPYV